MKSTQTKQQPEIASAKAFATNEEQLNAGSPVTTAQRSERSQSLFWLPSKAAMSAKSKTGRAKRPERVLFWLLGVLFSGILLASPTYANNNLSFEVTIGPSLGMSVSSNVVSLDLDPVVNTYNTSRLNVVVGTNNSTGYTLSVTSSSTDLTRTSSIVDGNGNTTTPIISTLPHLVGGYSESDFINNDSTINHWGYRLNSSTGNYYPFSTTLTLNSSTTPINNDPTTLDFIARIDSTKPAGTYELALNFTSVTNYVPTISDAIYLQNVTNDLISTTPAETTYTLKDKRDNQDYTVAILKDGKLWMTKNLNLAGGTVIESTMSDVPENYTLPTTNGFQSGNRLPASSTTGFSSDTTAYVYNSNSTSCDSGSPCYSYYSYAAATAGSGIAITTDNSDAPYSICPKGWTLPTSRTTATTDSEFYNLAVAYGMSSGVTSEATTAFYDRAGPNTIPNFSFSGYYLSSTFRTGGTHGYYWSPTAHGSTYAYLLNFGSSYVDSVTDIGNINRRHGFSVRCIFNN